MSSSTMVVSRYGQPEIGRVALYVHQLYIIRLMDGSLP